MKDKKDRVEVLSEIIIGGKSSKVNLKASDMVSVRRLVRLHSQSGGSAQVLCTKIQVLMKADPVFGEYINQNDNQTIMGNIVAFRSLIK